MKSLLLNSGFLLSGIATPFLAVFLKKACLVDVPFSERKIH